MSIPATPKWETDAELIAAALHALHYDARLRAEAETAAYIVMPRNNDYPSLTTALRDIAMKAAAIALLIHEGPTNA